MTEDDSEKLIAWGHMHAATRLVYGAFEMILDALWESDINGDPIGVNNRLRKLMNDAKELHTDMEHDTRKLFPNPLDDEKPTTTE